MSTDRNMQWTGTGTQEQKINLATHPAVQTKHALDAQADDDGITTLERGFRVKLSPVSITIIRDAMNRIPYPDVPKYYYEDREREIENPNHPDYLRAVSEVEDRRNDIAMDVILLFGVELLDEIADQSTWVPQLAYVGIEVDVDDPVQVRMAYLKYKVVDNEDWMRLRNLSGISEEAKAEALDLFPGDQE